MNQKKVLIIDIGGTHARSNIYFEEYLVFTEDFPTQKLKNFEELLSKIEKKSKIKAEILIVSAAGKIKNNKIQLSNAKNEIINEKKLEKTFEQVYILNDFVANAHSMRYLIDEDLAYARYVEIENILVIGAGTGLGMSYLTKIDHDKFKIKSSEEGHKEISLRDNFQYRFLEFCKKKLKKITYEDICSGRGLELTHEYITGKKISAIEILNKDKKNVKTIELFTRNYISIIKKFSKHFRCNTIFITGGIIENLSPKYQNQILKVFDPDLNIFLILDNITQDSLYMHYLEYRNFENIIQI